MPKQKTHKATAKRIKTTKKGKMLRMRAGRNHLRRKRSKRALRSYSRYEAVATVDQPSVRKTLGEPQRTGKPAHGADK